jgi:hypothetical protein
MDITYGITIADTNDKYVMKAEEAVARLVLLVVEIPTDSAIPFAALLVPEIQQNTS